MREREVYQNRLDDLFAQIPTLADKRDLQSHLVKFTCVLVCGYVEVALRDILQEYTRASASSEEVRRYVDKQLERSPNPSMGAILGLMRAFSEDWAQNLSNETKGKLQRHVDSLAANRNQIAHGKNENVVLSYAELKDYYRSALTVIKLIEMQCDTS